MSVGSDALHGVKSRRAEGEAADAGRAPALPADQASRLRLMVAQQATGSMYTVTVPRQTRESRNVPTAAPRSARRTPVVAITSGKGGVGKTSIAVNLAVALAQHKVRVTLLDADLGLANADVLCGLTPTTRLESVLGSGNRRRSMRQIAVDAPGGFRLVPGSVGLARMANLPASERDQVLQAMGELEADSDIVLVDTGAGVGEGVTSFVRFADAAIVVITPEPTAIADAYAMIKLLKTSPGLFGQPVPRMMIAVNQAQNEHDAQRVHARIASTCKRFLGFEPALLGMVRHDRACPSAVKARGPVVIVEPKSHAAKDLSKLSRSLAHELSLRLTAKERSNSSSWLSFLRKS